MRPSSSPTLSFALATVLITLSTAQAAAVPDEGKRVARVAKLEASAVPSVVLNAVTASPISTVTYSSLVAFGASYTDNAHPRNAEYASSLRNYWPYSKYGGRYQNGPVAVEQMVSSNISPKLKQSTQGIKLFDQAYGGSVIQNGLAGTWSSSPAAQDQIAEFFSSNVALGSGRALFYFNSGINPVTQIWLNAIKSGISSSSKAAARAAISSNTAAYAALIRSVPNNNKLRSRTGVDVLIAGIPALQLVPTFPPQVPSSFSSAQKADAVAFVGELSAQWNQDMKTLAYALKSELSKRGSRVFFFDMSALWSSMHKSPSSYGFYASPITKTCYNSASGSECSDPKGYLYYDSLHPTSGVHTIMAQKMNALVLGQTMW